MPSVGLEFITQMGVHIPDYLDAGLEMHSNIYHESSINAEVTVNSNQMRLSIPAPKSNIELLSIRSVSNDTKIFLLFSVLYFLVSVSVHNFAFSS